MAIDVPFIATAQMRDVDRLMMGEFRISLLQMMECAGRPLARLARDRFLNGDCKGKRVSVLVGTGGNGGGGMVCARRIIRRLGHQ
jgi:NAD(P)H-hydrate epimerase